MQQQQYFYIDSLKVIDGTIQFSGWCVDEKTDLPFTEYVLEADDEHMEVLISQRQDVVDVFGDEAFLESGFYARLPLNIFKTCDSFTFTGIRADGSREIIYQQLRKNGGI